MGGQEIGYQRQIRGFRDACPAPFPTQILHFHEIFAMSAIDRAYRTYEIPYVLVYPISKNLYLLVNVDVHVSAR